MSVFVYINVYIISRPFERRPNVVQSIKIYSHNFFFGKNICDDNFENRDFSCLKVSGANGVLDIYWEVAKFTTFEWIT